MFAHQVIEDIVKLSKGSPSDARYKEALKMAPQAIREAQKFHIESYSQLLKTTKNLEDSSMFLDYADFLRLPYDSIWVDYLFSGHKAGYLINSLKNDLWFLFHFHTGTTSNTPFWLLNPIAFLVSVGKEFSGRKEQEFKNRKGNIQTIDLMDMKDFDMSYEDIRIFQDGHLGCLNSFLLVLNCANITTETIPTPVNLNKKRIKKDREPITEYKVLRVLLPKNKQHKNANFSTDLTMKLHWQRGHFKRFTPSKPLFGKYTGLYWWQPHLRGDPAQGTIHKEYNISIN